MQRDARVCQRVSYLLYNTSMWQTDRHIDTRRRLITAHIASAARVKMETRHPVSQTRTVVRECFKDDDQSQWERPKFDPTPPLNPLTDRHQNLPTWLRRGYLPSCIISSRSDKGFRFCACAISLIKLFTRLFFRFFGSSSHHDRTDIDAKYVKRRGSVQGCAFWGSQNQTLSFTPLFAPKTTILGPVFDGTSKFSLKKAFNIGHVQSKLPLIVIVAP